MKHGTMMQMEKAHWVCLAWLLVGCGSVSDVPTDKLDQEMIGQGQLAFTTPQANSCTNGCLGGSPNGICDLSENNFICAQDCACGDGHCNQGSETPQTCPADCVYGTNPSNEDDSCGNNHCEPWEHDEVGLECDLDCGTGPANPNCGNGDCDVGETSVTCRADCGNYASCGNQQCEANFGETFGTCPVDCINTNIPAGLFVGTYCNGYNLVSRYADGNGGFDDRVVTNFAAGCGAYPWKLVSNAGTCEGSRLLKPDGTECTIQGAVCTTGANWALIGTEYAMQSDPNQCNHYRVDDNGQFQPAVWAKVRQDACSVNTSCTVYDCTGQWSTQTSGSVAVWRPQFGRWSIYASKCLP
jgi:hypothetical protein